MSWLSCQTTAAARCSSAPTSDRKSTSFRSSRSARKRSAKTRKLVARFEGKAKGLVLNDTNLETLETAFGPDSNDAIGGQVILFVDPDVRYGGQRVGGIRIKLPKKAAAKEKAAAKQTTAEFLNDDLP